MATRAHTTPLGVNELALPRASLLSAPPDRRPGLLPSPNDFSPAAIVARAEIYAAEHAARVARLPALLDARTGDELLAEMSLQIARAGETGATTPELMSIITASPRSSCSEGVESLLAPACASNDAQWAANPSRCRICLFAAARASNDAQLGALADEICDILDGAAYALDPVDDEDDQNYRLRQAERLMLRMVDIPAVGLAGIKAKAKAYLDSDSYDVLESSALATSLAEDAERICGGLHG